MRIDQQFTACDAFHAHTGKAGQRAAILAHIKAQGGTWTIGELARALGWQKSTLSARIRESLDAGELIVAKNRKDRVSGITVRPVMLPPMQRGLF